MIAFAIVGTKFDPSDTAGNYVTFRQFAIIMMISRLILLAQHLYVLYWVKHHQKIKTPLLIHIAAYAIGAIICLGLCFSFNDHTQTNSYAVFYVVAILEAVAVFASASQWRKVSLKRTNLNECCVLLTLIILGEGVIVLTKSMNNVTKGENYSPAIIGQIISATVIIVRSHLFFIAAH